MSLEEKLIKLRKDKGFSQEEVADKIGVSRQTISKWENGQSVPDVEKIKRLCHLYQVSYDFMMNESKTDQNFTNMEALSEAIDWTAAWSKKYPILASYTNMEEIKYYQNEINQLYEKMMKECNTSNQDTVLILKDILYQIYKQKRK